MHAFYVPNLTCGGCVKAVTSAVHALDPEALVETDVGRREVRIRSAATEKDLQHLLERSGYPASPLASVVG